eukprot:259497_1
MKGNRCIGILREVKNKWERRVPIIPSDVKKLRNKGIRVLIQPCNKRIFTNDEYSQAGAEVSSDISEAATILGVKEFPHSSLLPDRSYVTFSHTIKAQPENMPFLDACLEKNIRLFDYETIRALPENGGKRLVAFGRFAGVVGLIDCLRGLGAQLLAHGFGTPFMGMSSAYMYPSLDKAKAAVRSVGDEIRRLGFPAELSPLVFAFTGTGNVARGAREIFELLPFEMVSSADLKSLHESGGDRFKVYGCQLEPSDLVTSGDSSLPFDRSHYYENPNMYKPVFHERIAPYVTALVNGIYWDARFPRLLTSKQMANLMHKHPRAMQCIADISCDIEGSIEFMSHSTTIDFPFFVFRPDSGEIIDTIDGTGPVILGVDYLPAEVPREASSYFSSKLCPFIESLAISDGSVPFDQQHDLPEEFRAACITCHGELTPHFKYIQKLREKQDQLKLQLEKARPPTRSILAEGHLFDTGLINNILDVVEFQKGVATMEHFDAGKTTEQISRAVLKISAPSRAELNVLILKLFALPELMPRAHASIKELGHASEFRNGNGNGHGNGHGNGSPPPPTSPPKPRVLILGSGFVAGPLVDRLSSNSLNMHLTVASNDSTQAKALAEGKSNVAVKVCDATNIDSLESDIASSDLVISLLPATFHPAVADRCIRNRADLITASYVSRDMSELAERAREAGVTLLNEVGLDPGIDHMSAMKIIDEARASGGRVRSFESVCGGLPAPECARNPLRYKFSWNPRGVLTASLNGARYMRDGKVVEITGEDLLSSAEPAYIHPAFALEQLPNRDSLAYIEQYGLSDAQTMFRGTLRYAGFSRVMDGFRKLGLFSDRKFNEAQNWSDILRECSEANVASDLRAAISDFLNDPKKLENDTATVDALQWLGMINDSEPVSQSESRVDAFCKLLEKKLAYGPSERDMVLLHHKFGIEYEDRKERRTSTLLCYGEPNGYSAMAKTVGLPAAICAEMLITDQISSTGVITPVTSEIYKPCLAELEQQGIVFDEQCEVV